MPAWPARTIPTTFARTIGLAGLVWTLVLILLLYTHLSTVARHTQAMLRQQALWVVQLVTTAGSWELEHRAPAPPDRPALADMIRQVTDNGGSQGRIHFHVVGLGKRQTPPDAWEMEALTAFQHGSRERLELNEERKSFRYMGPLVVEKSCAGCHASASFRVGDVRGGISVTIPAGSFLQAQREECWLRRRSKRDWSSPPG